MPHNRHHTQNSIAERLKRLGRDSVRLVLADVSTLSPLTVTYDNGETAQAAVQLEGGALAVGDRVAVLKSGNAPGLVLGRVGQMANWGSGSMSFNNNTARTATVAHGLGATPAVAVATGTHAAMNASVTAADATNITVSLRQIDASPATGSFGFYWLASR